MNGEQKYHSLDGLRGLAALVVVLLHYVTAFLPFLIGYTITQRHTALDRIISTTPLQLPFAGNFAVCIFFVLSGFVLSLSFFKHKNVDVLISSAARRYFRLMIPALGSVLFVWLVLSLGFIHSHQASPLTESAWLANFWNFQGNIFHVLYQGLFGTFFTMYTAFGIAYNPVLWTMHYELFGSFLVFMYLALFGKTNNRWFFYAVFGVIFMQTYYLAFVAGMVIADIFLNYPKTKERISKRLLWVLLPIGLTLGAWNTETIYTGMYSSIVLPFFTKPETETLAHTIGAIIVILAILRLNLLERLFCTRPMQYLGKISFSLYLTHFVIMGSFASYVFVHLLPRTGYKLGFVLTFLPSLAVTFAVAMVYTRLVDIPSIAVSKKIGNFLVNGQLTFDWLGQLKQNVRKLIPQSGQPIIEPDESAG
ncbi:MAG: acyltransferase family protein [Candidatus Saccharimonadales bacterium]